MKKIFLAGLLIFSLVGQDAKADLSEDLEATLALIRIPIVIAANTSTFTKNKSTSQKFVLVTADVVRIYGELLSLVNKPGWRDSHLWDGFWFYFDAWSLIKHIKDLFSKKNEEMELEPEELKKLNKLLEAFHEAFLPFVEGVTAYIYAANRERRSTGPTVEIRNLCKTICSLSRVLDRLIISENKTFEQYFWAVVLVVNIFESAGRMLLVKEAVEYASRESRSGASSSTGAGYGAYGGGYAPYSRWYDAGASSSSGAGVGSTTSSDACECPICCEHKNMLILGCHKDHKICRECLSKLPTQQLEGEITPTKHCPFCRVII
jgi:hypothetical protein